MTTPVSQKDYVSDHESLLTFIKNNIGTIRKFEPEQLTVFIYFLVKSPSWDQMSMGMSSKEGLSLAEIDGHKYDYPESFDVMIRNSPLLSEDQRVSEIKYPFQIFSKDEVSLDLSNYFEMKNLKDLKIFSKF